MQLITYAGEPVAVVVDRDLAVFDPALEVRGLDDPLLRFAGAICQLAMELELGIAQGPCDEKRAEGYARELLMPAGEFSALAWLPDGLSGRFWVRA